MYKAIKEIGGFSVGDIVPDEKALVWLKMYNVPHVEKVNGEAPEPGPEEKEKVASESTGESSKDVMLDDYLDRNTNVVKKAIEEDDLSQEQLQKLLDLEESDKKRKAIIKSLKKKLEA